MNGDFRVPQVQNAEQPWEVLDHGLTGIFSAVCQLLNETASLTRMRNLLAVHAQQFEDDVRRLRDMRNDFRTRLELHMLPAPENPVERPAEPEEQPRAEIARGITILELADTNWEVESEDPAFNKDSVKLRYALSIDSVLCTFAFNKAGNLFAFADGKTAFTINSADGALIGACEIPPRGNAREPDTRAIVFSPDGKLLALSGQSNSVVIIDVASQRVIKTLDGHTHPVSSLAFLSNSQTLLSGAFDGRLCVWDMQTMELKKMIQHGKESQKPDEVIVSLSVASDDEYVAVGFMNGTVGIYEPTFSQPMSVFAAHDEYLLSISVGTNGLIATTSGDKTAKIWMLKNMASCKHTLVGHEDFVLRCTFAPSDPLVFTGSKDETIKCWNYNTGANLFTLTGHKNTVFQVDHHPTAKTIVSCSGEGLVCVWDYSF